MLFVILHSASYFGFTTVHDQIVTVPTCNISNATLVNFLLNLKLVSFI